MPDDAQAPEIVGVKVLAKLFRCTEQTVRNYVEDGIVVRVGRGQYDKDASTSNLIEHLRGAAAGRGGEDQVLDLTKQRARLASEQADAVEMKNRVMRGDLAPVADMQRAMADSYRKVRSRILAVPSRVRQLLGHIGQMEASVIDRELRDALAELGHADD